MSGSIGASVAGASGGETRDQVGRPTTDTTAGSPMLNILGLRIEVTDCRPHRPLVEDATIQVHPGESVGLVGESGSGKSMTVKAAMRLLPRNVSASGTLEFDGHSILAMSRRELARYRTSNVSIIHQDPRAHINPLRGVRDFLVEGVVSTGLMGSREATDKACQLLTEMGIADAPRRMAQYPHQLSGGLLQRVMIAAALLNEPKLVFADESTTALDVTVQSEVMAIIVEQIRDRGVGLLFITHDLDLAAAVTDTLVVMYAGTVVESGPVDRLYAQPRHPYTAALLASRPSTTQVKRLVSIPGRPASAYETGTGCVFAARCQFAIPLCHQVRPDRRDVDGRLVACHRAEDVAVALEAAASG